MKRPYLNQHQRMMIHLHRRGYYYVSGALLEVDLARKKLCKSIIKSLIK